MAQEKLTEYGQEAALTAREARLAEAGFDDRFRSLSFWSWNTDMAEAEIREQIRDFRQKGIHGFFVHARAGLLIDYMGEDWFRALSVAVDEAEKQHMQVWLYDEDGWPSGFAAGRIPAYGERLQNKRLKFCYGMPEAEARHRVARFVPQGSTYRLMQDWDNVGEADLCFYYEVNAHYADLLEEETTGLFLRLIHETYRERFGEHFGKTIQGVFTDEPQLNTFGLPWSFCLCEEFAGQNGYDLLSRLWLLAVDGEGYEALRHDFWNTVNDLFLHRYTEKIYRWCEKNGLKFTGHFACEDGLCNQVASNGGVMVNYAYMQIPGIDHLGLRITTPVLMRQVSSVARQLGRKQVLSESYGCAGWNISFAQMAWIWGWQASQGITLPCLHVSATSIKGIRKRDYPAFYSYQEPWWERYGLMSDWICGLNSTLTRGERAADVLVISPLTSVWCAYRTPENAPIKIMDISGQFRVLVENLIDIQVNFDIGDEKLMKTIARVEDHCLWVGEIPYRTVIVAESISLESHTLQLLNEFSEAGGTILFVNQRPTAENGRRGPEIDGKYRQIRGKDIQNRREILRKYFDFVHYERPLSVRERGSERIARDVAAQTRMEGDGVWLYLWNSDESDRRELTLVAQGHKRIWQVDPGTLQKTPLRAEYDAEHTYVDFLFHPMQSLLFWAENGWEERGGESGLLRTDYVRDARVEVCDDNALLLDYASFCIGDGPYSVPRPVIRLYDEIYEAAAGREEAFADVKVKFTFRTAGISGQPVWLAAELGDCSGVWVNGKRPERELGWWIDKAIRRLDITDLVCEGENSVVLAYRIPKLLNNPDLSKVFETERNRFCRPVEVENIYIGGRFDVETGEITRSANCLMAKNTAFCLIPRRPKCHDELTTQGLPFYRGRVRYTFSVMKSEDRVLLCLERIHGVLCDVAVNGRWVASLPFPPYETELTDWLSEGENTVSVLLYGSNRNLLGPHHHVKGEPNFVGPSTFKGRKGFEDFVSADIAKEHTWQEDYALVPFGLEKIRIKYMRKEGKP